MGVVVAFDVFDDDFNDMYYLVEFQEYSAPPLPEALIQSTRVMFIHYLDLCSYVSVTDTLATALVNVFAKHYIQSVENTVDIQIIFPSVALFNKWQVLRYCLRFQLAVRCRSAGRLLWFASSAVRALGPEPIMQKPEQKDEPQQKVVDEQPIIQKDSDEKQALLTATTTVTESKHQSQSNQNQNMSVELTLRIVVNHGAVAWLNQPAITGWQLIEPVRRMFVGQKLQIFQYDPYTVSRRAVQEFLAVHLKQVAPFVYLEKFVPENHQFVLVFFQQQPKISFDQFASPKETQLAGFIQANYDSIHSKNFDVQQFRMYQVNVKLAMALFNVFKARDGHLIKLNLAKMNEDGTVSALHIRILKQEDPEYNELNNFIVSYKKFLEDENGNPQKVEEKKEAPPVFEQPPTITDIPAQLEQEVQLASQKQLITSDQLPLAVQTTIVDQILNECLFSERPKLKFDLRSHDFRFAEKWLFGENGPDNMMLIIKHLNEQLDGDTARLVGGHCILVDRNQRTQVKDETYL